jgi:hypothetical protein
MRRADYQWAAFPSQEKKGILQRLEKLSQPAAHPGHPSIGEEILPEARAPGVLRARPRRDTIVARWDLRPLAATSAKVPSSARDLRPGLAI